MPIVFEEEQQEIEKDKEIAESRVIAAEAQSRVLQPLWEKIFMVFFAIGCIAGAVAIQLYYNPDAAAGLNTVYRDEVTEADLRLIPPSDRAAYLNSLPVRK